MAVDSIDPKVIQRQSGSPWSVRDAAKFLGISERHLVRLINDAKVSSFMLGRRRFVSDVELRRVAEGGASSKTK